MISFVMQLGRNLRKRYFDKKNVENKDLLLGRKVSRNFLLRKRTATWKKLGVATRKKGD